MKILAMDLAKSKSVTCVFTGAIQEARFGSVATTRVEMAELIRRERPDRVVFEIGPIAGWLHALCIELGVPEVQVANANHEAWRWKNVKRKTDREDALKLARLSAGNDLPMVHVPAPAVQLWRQLIQTRQSLVARRTKVKNRIRSILRQHAMELAAGNRGWSKMMVSQLCEMMRAHRDELWAEMVRWELAQLRLLTRLMRCCESRLNRIALGEPRVALLRTIPGVGPRLAETIVAIIDDPRRFRTGKQVGCYAGLTPREYHSGSMHRQGRISGEGNALLRALLVEVAWIGQRFNPWMKQIYLKATGGLPGRKKIAIVAVARRLLVRCWAMLRDGRPWRMSEAGAHPPDNPSPALPALAPA